jgi:hypothetical protein
MRYEGPKHKSHLKSRNNHHTPHFQQGKHPKELCLQQYHILLHTLLNVDKLKNVTKQIDSCRRVEVFVDMLNHLKSLAIEA